MSDLSLRNDIKDWLFGEIDGQDSYDVQAIVDAAMTHFRQDIVFRERFLEAFLRPVIMSIHRDVAQKVRRAALDNRPQPMQHSIAVKSAPAPVVLTSSNVLEEPRESVSLMPVEAVDVVALIEAMPTSERWRRWAEVDPETGLRKSVFKMTKRALLNAADARDAAAMTSVRTSALMRLMAGPLANDDDLVETYWGSRVRQLDRMYEDIEVVRARFHLRSLMQGAAD